MNTKELEKRCNELFFQVNEKTERIAGLEKENAELKDDNKVMADNYSKMEQKFYDNLTKAKEIIGELFHYIPSWTGKENDKPRVYAMPDELRAKAEQFLNSEVEKE